MKSPGTPSRRSCFWRLLAGWLLPAGAVLGQIIYQGETITFVPAVTTLTGDGINLPSAATVNSGVSTAHGNATAFSTLGFMHLTANSGADAALADDTVMTGSFSRVKWSDSILVTATAPELNGATGVLHTQFQVSGALAVTPGAVSSYAYTTLAESSWNVSVNRSNGFGSENSVAGGISLYNDYNVETMTRFTTLNGSAGFGVYDLYIPFTFGEAFAFTFQGIASNVVQPRGMSPGDGIFGSADVQITWLGVAATLDEFAMPLAGITIQSTGDWMTAAPIPEPSTYAALAGVAALGLAVWRRQRQPA